MSKKNTGSSLAVNSVVVLVICNMFSKTLGFLRESFMSWKYGTTSLSDSYFMATTIIAVTIIGTLGAIATAYVPIYSQSLNDTKDKDAPQKYHNTIFTVAIIISLTLSVLMFIFAKNITMLFDSGYSQKMLSEEGTKEFMMTVKFVRIMSVCAVFNCLTQMISGFLQLKNKFLVSGLSGIVLNACFISGILLSSESKISILAYSFVLGHVSTFVILYIYSKRTGFTYKPSISDNNGYMKETWRMIAPIFMGNIMNEINQIVDKRMGSKLVPGSISALNYANKIQGLITAIFVASVVTVLFPKLSKDAAEGNHELIRSGVRSTSLTMCIIIIPISAIFLILSKQIIALVYMRGSFNADSLEMTSAAFIFYSVGLLALCLRDVMNNALYAMQTTLVPIIINIFGLLVNIVLNYVFIEPLQIRGVALASSISLIIRIILLMLATQYIIKHVFERQFFREMLKFIMGAVAMGIIMYVIKIKFIAPMEFSQGSNLLWLIITCIIGLIVYAATLAVTRSKTFYHWVFIFLGYTKSIKNKLLKTK